MLWTTRSSTRASSGRSSQLGEAIHVAPEHIPPMSTRKRGAAGGLSMSTPGRHGNQW